MNVSSRIDRLTINLKSVRNTIMLIADLDVVHKLNNSVYQPGSPACFYLRINNTELIPPSNT